MTCIAVKVYPNAKRVDFAFDSQTTDNGTRMPDEMPKVCLIDGWGLVGSSGDSGVCQRAWGIFAGAPDLDRLMPRLQPLQSGTDATAGWILYRGGLVLIDTLGQIMRPAMLWWALGSGSDVALGALAAGASPRRAVEIACRFDLHCGPPVRVFTRAI